MIAGGEILSNGNYVHEFNAEGEAEPVVAEPVVVEVSDPIEEEIK